MAIWGFFQSTAAYGCDRPVLKGTLRLGAGKPETWFELCRKDALVYARRAGDDAVLKVDGKKADELLQAFKQI